MIFSELIIAPVVIGMGHSIETDHVLAVGNLVDMKRSNIIKQAYKGASWGLGHTISVALGVVLMGFMKTMNLFPGISLELFAGLLLVFIGILKIWRFNQPVVSEEHKKSDFFHVGLVHGLAGSGAVAILLASRKQELWSQVSFLFLFGIGTIIGMAILTGLLTRFQYLNMKILNFISCILAILSIGYGLKIIINQIS